MLKDLMQAGRNVFPAIQPSKMEHFVDVINEHILYMITKEYITPDELTVNTGGTAIGDIDDVKTLLDGNVYQLPEVAGVPGFDLEFTFENMVNIKGVVFRIYYAGSATHTVTFDIWNYLTEAWDELILVPDTLDYNLRYIETPDDTNYIGSDKKTKIRLYHSTSGNASHDLYIDYIALLKQRES